MLKSKEITKEGKMQISLNLKFKNRLKKIYLEGC
jgi:hypothetical protein